MNDSKSQDRRIKWLMIAVAFNTATSLLAIGLWFFAPNHARESARIVHATGAPIPGELPRPPHRPIASRPPELLGPTSMRPERKEPPPIPLARLDAKGSTAKVDASTLDLAQRLQLEPQVLARDLGDENGVVSKSTASRLERAFDDAKSLAKRENLDAAKTQSLVTLMTYHAFSMLREEKVAGTGPVDPTRIEEIEMQTMSDLSATCGEQIATLAMRELEKH